MKRFLCMALSIVLSYSTRFFYSSTDPMKIQSPLLCVEQSTRVSAVISVITDYLNTILLNL